MTAIPEDVRERAARRFWAKVDKTGDCWLWSSAQDGNGYGSFHLRFDGRRTHKAHRIAYELATGEAPPQHLLVMHACDNRLCVNPAHLSVGSQKQNMQDAAERKRIVNVGKALLTHCKRGHEFTPGNTYWDGKGHRRCFTCIRARRKVELTAKRAAAILQEPKE